ncbi:MAG TPA: recombination protein RecR, partial [Magnetospirillaceae bacterium]|nr:recombination protein RecR [Magnetospirillaceae bacterium]
MRILEEFVGLLSRLPGIGRKSASRIAFHLLKADESYARALADRILDLRNSVRFCSSCGAWAEKDPCPICSSPNRDRSLLCVVEQPQDVFTL